MTVPGNQSVRYLKPSQMKLRKEPDGIRPMFILCQLCLRERPFDFNGGQEDFLKKIIKTVIITNKIDRMTKQTKRISRTV